MIYDLVEGRRGHFLLESGLHSELWLDLDPLARYELPSGFHSRVARKRVAIVDDVMSAGSALRGTYTELRTLGAHVVAAGALLVLGDKGADYFAAEGLPVVFTERDGFSTWAPAECPLCATGVPLEAAGVSRTRLIPNLE